MPLPSGTGLSRWKRLKLNSFLWAFCHYCRTGIHPCGQDREWIPTNYKGLDFNNCDVVPQYGLFLSYAARHCRSRIHFLDVNRFFVCWCQAETAADWQYLSDLLETYYGRP